MGFVFWVRRFFTVFAAAFLLIAVAQLARGRAPELALPHAGTWAALAASVFTVSRFYQSRRGQHCAICRDTPEMLPSGPDAGPGLPRRPPGP